MIEASELPVETTIETPQGTEKQPVLAIALGRGRTGKSTVLDLMTQLARGEGRKVTVVDADVRGRTLSGFYPPGTEGGALTPPSAHPGDMKEWLGDVIEEIGRDRGSVVLDLGGSGRVLQEMGREADMIRFSRKCQLEPLAVFLCGPDAGDLEHVMSIWEAGYFRPERSVLLLNQHLAPSYVTRNDAFAPIAARPELRAMIEQGLRVTTLPTLTLLSKVHELGLGILQAEAGERSDNVNTPLSLFDRARISSWSRGVRDSLQSIKAAEWLP